MSFRISDPIICYNSIPGKRLYTCSCTYNLNEGDGSVYQVIRLMSGGSRRLFGGIPNNSPASAEVKYLLDKCEFADLGLMAKGDWYRNIQAKVLMVAAPIIIPQPIDNTLQATQQKLAITQQAQAALQQEAVIAQQNLAAVKQQAVIAEQQAAVLRQNLAATQQQAAIAQQQAAILQRDLSANQQQLALSVEEIRNLKGQNLFLYSLVQEKDRELSLLIVDRDANIERRQILEGQIANLLVLIRQFINSGR